MRPQLPRTPRTATAGSPPEGAPGGRRPDGAARRVAVLGLLIALTAGAGGGRTGDAPAPRADRTGPERTTPHPARADTIAGTVREAAGRPIPTARIELRREGRVLGSTRSEDDGRFRLVLRAPIDGPVTVRVERFGYHAQERTVTLPATGELAFTLTPAPLPLPGIGVDAARDACEAREDPDARALWEAMAERHPSGLDTLGLATYLHGWTDTLAAPSRDPVEGRVGTPGQRGSAPLLRLSWNRRVQREGYAFAVRRTDREHSYDSWSYAPLEADFAPHFVHATFGRLHRFQMEEDGAGAWILRFCTRDRDDPWIEGSLEVGPDTVLHRAEWRFRTPEPDEEAGGWARFPEATLDDPHPVPLPVESVVWRRLPDGGVFRRAQAYEGWILSRGDSVPFLRARDVAEERAVPAPDGG